MKSIYTIGVYEHNNAPSNVNVVFPGLLGDVLDQTTPILPTLKRNGHLTLMMQPVGPEFDPERYAADSAETIADELRRHGGFETLTAHGVSMGGLAVAGVVRMLAGNRTFEEYSTEPFATVYDAPTGIADLAAMPPFLRHRPNSGQLVGAKLGALPTGRFMDKLINKMAVAPKPDKFEENVDVEAINVAFERMAQKPFVTWRDHLKSIVEHGPLWGGSLQMLGSLAYVESLQGGDVVVAESAINTWSQTVAPEKFRVIQAHMPHVAFDQAPRAANTAVQTAFDWHHHHGA